MMQLLLNIVLLSFLYLLLSFSFRIIYSSFGFFHFAHAISIVLGVYLFYTFSITWHWPDLLSLPLSLMVVILVVVIINKLIYKPLLKNGTSGWQMMIVSMGLFIVLQNAISMIWGDGALSICTWEVKVGHEFLGAYITDVQIFTVLASVVLLFSCWLFTRLTNSGKRIKAIASNAELGTILGISKDVSTTLSLIIGTGLAACAGLLIAADNGVTPTMGFNWLLYAVVAMIIGGMGKMHHLILGAVLLATAQVLVAYFFDSKWMNATAYIILVVFLYFRPYGFSGKKLKKTEI